MGKNFNVRAYGILIYNDSILVSDEYIKGNKITKFPGGGLEFGEGLHECVIREFKEELDLKIGVTEHFYTTDFYVSSSFDVKSQVISVYYEVNALSDFNFKTSKEPHDYVLENGSQSLRWITLSQLKDTDFTLIIDRKVGEMLMKKYNTN